MADEAKLDSTQSKLLEGILRLAEQEGVEVKVVTVTYNNDDVARFLERITAFEEASRKVNPGPIRGSYTPAHVGYQG